jgi:hypothetical protein
MFEGYMNSSLDTLRIDLSNSEIEQLKLSSAVTSLEVFRGNLTKTKGSLMGDYFLISVGLTHRHRLMA